MFSSTRGNPSQYQNCFELQLLQRIYKFRVDKDDKSLHYMKAITNLIVFHRQEMHETRYYAGIDDLLDRQKIIVRQQLLEVPE